MRAEMPMNCLVFYRCRGMLFARTQCSVSPLPSMKRHRGCSVCCVANRFHMGSNGWLLHRCGSIHHGTEVRSLLSSYECVCLCYMNALYDNPRATGGKRAEHRTRRYTVAGNFDCKLHQTTSTARTLFTIQSGEYGIRA